MTFQKHLVLQAKKYFFLINRNIAEIESKLLRKLWKQRSSSLLISSKGSKENNEYFSTASCNFCDEQRWQTQHFMPGSVLSLCFLLSLGLNYFDNLYQLVSLYVSWGYLTLKTEAQLLSCLRHNKQCAR